MLRESVLKASGSSGALGRVFAVFREVENMKVKFNKVSALLAGLLASGLSMAQTAPATAQEAFDQAADAATGFGPGMWALAAGSVAILIAVKWIKRARGAA